MVASSLDWECLPFCKVARYCSRYCSKDKYSNVKAGLELYDLEADASETRNVAGKHPAVVQRLEALAEQAREDLGDSLTKRVGKGVREPGRLAER